MTEDQETPQPTAANQGETVVAVTPSNSTLGMWPRAVVVVGACAMFVALFLPWTFSSGVANGLAEYAAPGPTEAAWLLIAFGMALTLVAGGAFIFGTRRAITFVVLGGAVYGVGVGLYYVSTVLPNVVAGGCISDPGTLCGSSPGLATIPITPGSGILLALLGTGWTLIGAAVIWRFTKARLTRPSTV